MPCAGCQLWMVGCAAALSVSLQAAAAPITGDNKRTESVELERHDDDDVCPEWGGASARLCDAGVSMVGGEGGPVQAGVPLPSNFRPLSALSRSRRRGLAGTVASTLNWDIHRAASSGTVSKYCRRCNNGHCYSIQVCCSVPLPECGSVDQIPHVHRYPDIQLSALQPTRCCASKLVAVASIPWCC